MKAPSTYEHGEIVGENPGDLSESVSDLPQQLDERMTRFTRETEPVVDVDGEKMHPRDLFLKPSTIPGVLIRYSSEHKKKTAAIGVVTVGVVLAAYAGVRLRKRQK